MIQINTKQGISMELCSKSLVLSFLAVCWISIQLNAQLDYAWAHALGSTGTEDGANSIAVDTVGNVYVTGTFSGTVDFDPGAGTANLTSPAPQGMAVFIAKYDSSGNYLWAGHMGVQQAMIEVVAIDIDPLGNCYVAGHFGANPSGPVTVDFDPGIGTANLTTSGFLEIFVAKYDASGNYVWAKSTAGNGFSISAPNDLVVDVFGEVYFTGGFSGEVDFDPGAGTASVTSTGATPTGPPTSPDIFIAKYSTSGAYVWIKHLASATAGEQALGNALAIGSVGDVYLTGEFDAGTLDFDPGPGTASLTANGSRDIFLAKYTASGDYNWAFNIGSTSANAGQAIKLDAMDNIHVAGFFTATTDFDPSGSTNNLVAGGDRDIFLAKYDSVGNHIWAFGAGDATEDQVDALALDNVGNSYITGHFNGTVDFDPGVGTENLISLGGADVFVAKYNQNGQHVWSKQLGGTDTDLSNAIDRSPQGHVYLAGEFMGTSDFDPGPGFENRTSAGQRDAFIAKYVDLTVCSPVAVYDTVEICSGDTHNFGAQALTAAGSYSEVFLSIAGCDSTVTLELVVNSVFDIQIVESICDGETYVFGSQSITQTGAYSEVFQTVSGCDSIVNLDVSVHPVETETASETICEGETYGFGTQTLNATGTYTEVFQSSHSCDSTVTLSLVVELIDNSITQDEHILTSNEAGAFYQWLDCNDGNSPIAEATDQVFEATENGSFAVRITKNGCTETSGCLDVTTLGFGMTKNRDIKIYPNPGNGNFVVQTDQTTSVEVYDALGQIICSKTFHPGNHLFDLTNQPTGVYLVKVTRSGEIQKLIIR